MKMRILFLSANPTDQGRIRSDEEYRDISEGLRRSRDREKVDLRSAWAVRPENLRRELLDFEPHIVHFSGHGAAHEGICLLDDRGRSFLVAGQVLSDMFRSFPSVKCVVLNACNSDFQARAIVAQVDYVIGVSGPIEDEAAKRFSVALYDAIGAGQDIPSAFEIAQNALDMYGYSEGGKPILFSKSEPSQHVPVSIRTEVPLLPREPREFVGRSDQLERLKDLTEKVPLIAVYGISGIGKTALLRKLARVVHDEGRLVLLVEGNILTSIEGIQKSLSLLLFSHGKHSETQALQNSEMSELARTVAQIVSALHILVVFDSVNSVSSQVRAWLGQLTERLCEEPTPGCVVVASTANLEFYERLQVLSGQVAEFELRGLSPDEFDTLFATRGLTVGAIERKYFDLVGGHPLSLRYLVELSTRNTEKQASLVDPVKEALLETESWLFRQVYLSLEQSEQETLLAVSVFPYPFGDQEIEALFGNKLRARYLLDPLARRFLINSVDDDSFIVHESIQRILAGIASREKLGLIHKRIEQSYRQQILALDERQEEVAHELIFKWGFHLESAGVDAESDIKLRQISELGDNEVVGLWAIMERGFPYDFESPSLRTSRALLTTLLRLDLVQPLSRLRRLGRPRGKYVLKDTSFLAGCFLVYLCIGKGLADHLGYYARFEPNYAFREQQLYCPWEHCIEHLPLHHYVSESCPIFGHDCPAGAQQANLCRTNPTSRFVWADSSISHVHTTDGQHAVR